MNVSTPETFPRPEKVLVTGGKGFIGVHLCRELCSEGVEVHATSRQHHTQVANGPVWWKADLADLADARRIFSEVRPHAVFHLAGSVGARPDVELVLPTYHSLATSTVNVLTLAQEFGCRRIVLPGSFTEPVAGVEPTPGSPYAAAKWTSSAYGRMFHALYGTPVVNLRPFMTYGPDQAPGKLIPFVMRSLLRGEAPKLSSGRITADWVFISDIVRAFLLALTAPGIEGATIDLGSGSLVSVRTVVERLAAIVGGPVKPQFDILPDRPSENEIAADTALAAMKLGWTATTSLQSGLQQTVDWYRAQAQADGNQALP